MANNPTTYSDPLGDTTQYYNIETGALMGTINNEGAVTRVKMNSNFYNYAIAGAAANDQDLTDQSVANTFVSTLNNGVASLEDAMNSVNPWQRFNLIAFETGQSLSFTGNANANNPA